MRATTFLLAATLATASLAAQVRPGIFGHLVQGQNGTAGEFCLQFDCTPRPLAVVAGETLTLIVNAPYQAPFAIGLSLSATSCIALPFAANQLILDPPFVVVALGLVSQHSPILACWGGRDAATLPLPPGLPLGLQFATQAICEMQTLSGTMPAFSVAVLATVR